MNCITPEDLGGNIRWIVATTKNAHVRASDLFQQALEISICRDQDKVTTGGVFQNPAIPGSSKPVLKSTLRRRKQVAQKYDQFRRMAFVEEELYLPETLLLAASSAA